MCEIQCRHAGGDDLRSDNVCRTRDDAHSARRRSHLRCDNARHTETTAIPRVVLMGHISGVTTFVARETTTDRETDVV